MPVLGVDPNEILDEDRAAELEALLQHAGHTWRAVLLLDGAEDLFAPDTPTIQDTTVSAGAKINRMRLNSARALARGLVLRYPGVVIMTSTRTSVVHPEIGGCVVNLPRPDLEFLTETWLAGIKDIAEEVGRCGDVCSELWGESLEYLERAGNLDVREIHSALGVLRRLVRSARGMKLTRYHVTAAMRTVPCVSRSYPLSPVHGPS